MSLAVVMAFEILAALALGFVIGRIWQIRRDELDRRNFKVPPVARIPRLQSPLSARFPSRSSRGGLRMLSTSAVKKPRQPAATVAEGGRLRSEA